MILVGGYSGLGVHTLLNAVRFAPGHFKNMVFISVAVVDSGNFKGAAALEDLRQHTEDSLAKYVDLARRLGMPATSYMTIGTEPVHELEHTLPVDRQAISQGDLLRRAIALRARHLVPPAAAQSDGLLACSGGCNGSACRW